MGEAAWLKRLTRPVRGRKWSKNRIILHKIQGLGGTVLKTNVDLERAKLIQSTLAAAAPPDLDR